MIGIIAGTSALCMHNPSLHQAVHASSCLLFIAISTTMVPVARTDDAVMWCATGGWAQLTGAPAQWGPLGA